MLQFHFWKINFWREYGLLVLLELADNEKDIEYLAQKLVNLRIFEWWNGAMNLSVSGCKAMYNDCKSVYTSRTNS